MSPRPDFIKRVTELPDNGGTVWPWTGSDEVLGFRTALSRPLGLKRVGVHQDVLRPGQRSSHPHAERWEEECVFVLEGELEAVIDGVGHPMGSDDIAVFAPGTGIEHTIRNIGPTDARILVIGERIDSAHIAAERWIALWNDRDPGAAADLFTEHATVFEAVGGRTHRGLDAIRAHLTAAFAAGATARAATEIVPSADRFAIEWEDRAGGRRWRGTSIALLDGLSPRIRSLSDYAVEITD